VSTRVQNEKKFGNWNDLPGGGRRYWLDVAGRMGWRARYCKDVDSEEATVRFWQEFTMIETSWLRFIRNTRPIRDTRKCRSKHGDY